MRIYDLPKKKTEKIIFFLIVIVLILSILFLVSNMSKYYEKKGIDLRESPDTEFFQGTLDIVMDGSSNEGIYVLQTVDYRFYKLRFDLEPEDLDSGIQINLLGTLNGNTINVSTYNILNNGLPASVLPNDNLGAQKTAVFRIKFRNDPINLQPLDNNGISALMSEMNSYLREISYNRASIDFNSAEDIYGLLNYDYDLSISGSDDCSNVFGRLIEDIRVCALFPDSPQDCRISPVPTREFYEELSKYKRVFFMSLNQNRCNYNGLSTTIIRGYSSSPSIRMSHSYLNGPTGWDAGTTAHEMGHQFGILHSADLECGPEIIGEENYCGNNYHFGRIENTNLIYGDYLCIMGRPDNGILVETRHMSLPQKERAGWMNLGEIVSLDDSNYGIYNIEPLEVNNDPLFPQGLKFYYKDENNRQVYYYIEYRRPLGSDLDLTNDNASISGVFLEINRKTTYNDGGVGSASSQLLDATPRQDNSNSMQIEDSHDSVLRVGQERVLPSGEGNVYVSVLGVDNTGAFVRVSDSPRAPLCFDGIDNDGDGKIDLEDYGCSDPGDDNEDNCGDGVIEQGEQCDDGNLNNPDGCSSTCQIQTYFECSGQPSICKAICTDSDGGDKPYRKGIVNIEAYRINVQDSCFNTTMVREYICDWDAVRNETFANSKVQSCNTWCTDGYCTYSPQGGPIPTKVPKNPVNNLQ